MLVEAAIAAWYFHEPTITDAVIAGSSMVVGKGQLALAKNPVIPHDGTPLSNSIGIRHPTRLVTIGAVQVVIVRSQESGVRSQESSKRIRSTRS
jgi:hypothetical protein